MHHRTVKISHGNLTKMESGGFGRRSSYALPLIVIADSTGRDALDLIQTWA